jgi:hypothetical protein
MGELGEVDDHSEATQVAHGTWRQPRYLLVHLTRFIQLHQQPDVFVRPQSVRRDQVVKVDCTWRFQRRGDSSRRHGRNVTKLGLLCLEVIR